MIRAEKSRKDEGFSLIEVIVSMLILAIIVMPLLQNFLVAQQTNVKAKQAQYATALNGSIMEGIKEFSIDEVAVQFFEPDKDKFYLVSQGAFTSEGGYYQVDQEGNRIPSRHMDACVSNGVFIDSKKKYLFQINGVRQGTSVYDVKITYDSSAYTGTGTVGQNKYQMPKVEALDANYYALIDPFSSFRTFSKTESGYQLISTDNYDMRVRKLFYQLHKNYYMELWLEKCREVQEENAKRQIEADKNGVDPVLLPLPTQKPAREECELNERIIRKIKITLNKISEASYEVSAKVSYSASAEAGYFWSDATKTKEFDLYSTPLSFTTLKGVYLFYPLYETETGATHDYRNLETLEIEIKGQQLKSDEYLDVYVAMQEESVPDSYPPLKVNVTGIDSSHIRLHSQEKLQGNTGEIVSNLVGNYEAEDRIYDVLVEIYEAGTSNLVSSMTSTIRK